MARQLVELGYRGTGDVMKQEEFEARKKILMDRATQKGTVVKQLAGADRDLRDVSSTESFVPIVCVCFV